MCAEVALEDNKKAMKHTLTRHLRILLPRYRNHQQISNVQRTARYVIISTAILILFTITIVVHLPKPVKRVKTENLNRDGVKVLIFRELDLRQGSEELLLDLENLYQQGVRLVNLVLIDTKHDKNCIKQGWLNINEDKHPRINSLTLDNKLLEEIGDYSFDCMKQLTELVIINTKLKFLTRNAFKDLHKVWSFSLRDNKELEWIESGLVREFGLTTLQIEGMDFSDQHWSEEFFGNLTGGAVLSTLTILELRENRMPIILPSYLKNFPQLISLYLIKNTIQSIEPSSFTSLKTIQLVDISENELTTFPEPVFSYLLTVRKTQLYIANNPITCDCNLTWLRESAVALNLTQGLQTAQCKTPEIHENQPILEVQLCTNTTTELPPTTELPSTTTTTTTEKIKTTIECTDKKTRKKFSISPEMSLTTRNHSRITIKETENAQEIQIILTENTENLAVAFVCRECYEIHCETVDKHATEILIHGVRPSTDYLLCIFGGTEIETGFIDFSDCLAYHTQALISERPWLTNGDKNWTIASIALTAFFVFVFGGLIAFCIVRMKPSLLKGSGRVEVVKSRNGELVLVMPERRAAPSPTYDTISGYVSLTPQDKSPPPLPPYPPTWFKRNKEEVRRNFEDREYLEPKRLYPIRFPRNKDLLLEYEWYTQHYRQDK